MNTINNPPFYSIVDKLYNTVMKIMPELVKEREVASAFVLGCSGAYGLTKLTQNITKKIGTKIIPAFEKKQFPTIEKVLTGAVLSVPLIYAIVDPETVKQIITHHPVYSSGMLGVYTGGLTAVVQDLVRKK